MTLSKEIEKLLHEIEDKKTRSVYRSFLKDQLEFQEHYRTELIENKISLEKLNKKPLHEIIKEAIRKHEEYKNIARRGIELNKEWIKKYEEKYRKCVTWMKEKIDNGEKIIG